MSEKVDTLKGWHACQGLADRIARDGKLIAFAHLDKHNTELHANRCEQIAGVRVVQEFIDGGYSHCPYCGGPWRERRNDG